jgi:hypothetical protein
VKESNALEEILEKEFRPWIEVFTWTEPHEGYSRGEAAGWVEVSRDMFKLADKDPLIPEKIVLSEKGFAHLEKVLGFNGHTFGWYFIDGIPKLPPVPPIIPLTHDASI